MQKLHYNTLFLNNHPYTLTLTEISGICPHGQVSYGAGGAFHTLNIPPRAKAKKKTSDIYLRAW